MGKNVVARLCAVAKANVNLVTRCEIDRNRFPVLILTTRSMSMSTLRTKQARYAAVQQILKTTEPDLDLLANILFTRMKVRKSPINGGTIPLSNCLKLPAVKNILMQIPPDALEAIVINTPFDKRFYSDPKKQL